MALRAPVVRVMWVLCFVAEMWRWCGLGGYHGRVRERALRLSGAGAEDLLSNALERLESAESSAGEKMGVEEVVRERRCGECDWKRRGGHFRESRWRQAEQIEEKRSMGWKKDSMIDREEDCY